MDKLIFKRILIGGLSFLAIVYVIYLFMSANFSVYNTENAVENKVTDTIYSNGFVIRDESFVTNNSTGVLAYEVDDGEQVSAGLTIAKVYKTEKDVISRTQIESLEKQKASLEKLQEQKRANSVGIETISADINNNFIALQKNLNKGNITQLTQNSNSIINAINHYQIYTGKVSDFSGQIASLATKINELASSSNDSIGEIKTSKAGYFSTKTDGYEQAFDYKKIKELTLDDIARPKKTNVSSSVSGKVISSLNWYIACKISDAEAKRLTLWDSTVSVRFSDAYSEKVLASIYSIKQDPNGNDALLILECNYMNKDLTEIRNEDIEIGMGTYNGYKVSKKAIHDDYIEKVTYDDNDNKKVERKKVQGVYVLYGSEVQFKEISIIYAENDFVICDPNPEDGILFSGKTLSLYDQVILEGDDLYDGKVVK